MDVIINTAADRHIVDSSMKGVRDLRDFIKDHGGEAIEVETRAESYSSTGPSVKIKATFLDPHGMLMKMTFRRGDQLFFLHDGDVFLAVSGASNLV